MKINPKLLAEIISDLGLNVQFVKGENKVIRNCWHFCTDGNAVDAMFYDEADFVAGMNRIYVTVKGYRVVILAFILMDTHVHFILYGEYDECNRFMHEYIRRTSWYISTRHKETKKLDKVPLSCQKVDTDAYLKTVICYTIKNAPSGGIGFNAWNYPWGSGALYFQKAGYWTSPAWMSETQITHAGDTCRALANRDGRQANAPSGESDTRRLSEGSGLANGYNPTRGTVKERQKILRTRDPELLDAPMIGDLVYPGEYVAYEIVEKVFRTCKSLNYFLCKTKEDDVDGRGGSLSHLSVPIQEMRQHKNELCRELFGASSIKGLDTRQRVLLARTLHSRYNSSPKQIIRLCGLVYNEAKGLI